MKRININFALCIVAIFFCSIMQLIQPDSAYCKQRVTDMETDSEMTVGELLQNKNVKLKTWYWVDIRPMNIDRNLYNPAKPLLEGSKAVVVPASFYDKAGLRMAWVGFMFEKIQTPSGEEIILKRRVDLMHYGEVLDSDNPEHLKEINQRILTSMIMPLVGRPVPNVYYFKRINELTTREISADEAAFLRSYYMVGLKDSNKESIRFSIFKVDVKVGAYINYEYYPSGTMSKRTEIQLGSRRNEPVFYNVYTQTFNDKGMKPKAKEVDKTTVHDPSSPMWLQNMLHD